MPVAVLFAALMLTPPPQAARPSFDCRAASTLSEHAICADPALARLDARMAARFAAVRRALPPAARAELLRDQRWFLAARDEWQSSRTTAAFRDFPDLERRMTTRIEFLDSLGTVSGGELAGLWRNAAGYVDINPIGQGRVRLDMSASHPTNARWICSVDGTARVSNGVVNLVPDGGEGWRIRITLKPGFISVEETGPDDVTRPYCGSNGHLDGSYFRSRRD